MVKLNHKVFLFYKGSCVVNDFSVYFNKFLDIMGGKGFNFIEQYPEGKIKYNTGTWIRLDSKNHLRKQIEKLSENEKNKRVLSVSLEGLIDLKRRYSLGYRLSKPDEDIMLTIYVDPWLNYSEKQSEIFNDLITSITNVIGRSPN